MPVSVQSSIVCFLGFSADPVQDWVRTFNVAFCAKLPGIWPRLFLILVGAFCWAITLIVRLCFFRALCIRGRRFLLFRLLVRRVRTHSGDPTVATCRRSPTVFPDSSRYCDEATSAPHATVIHSSRVSWIFQRCTCCIISYHPDSPCRDWIRKHLGALRYVEMRHLSPKDCASDSSSV
jgi:hypothetical protein